MASGLARCTAVLAALGAPAPAAGAERTLPTATQIAQARAVAAERPGRVAWAVIDSRGRIHGRHGTRRYASASVTKALLLAAALRQAGRRPLPADLAALLGPMVRRSDNDAAHVVYRRVGGDAALLDVARAAGMRRLTVNGTWSNVGITAGDVARFFLVCDRIVPRRHRGYARELLGGVVPRQRWGIPRPAERAGWRVLLKGGWRKGMVHQGALAERDGRRVAVAVLTDGNPSFRHGATTIRRIARRLLRRPADGA